MRVFPRNDVNLNSPLTAAACTRARNLRPRKERRVCKAATSYISDQLPSRPHMFLSPPYHICMKLRDLVLHRSIRHACGSTLLCLWQSHSLMKHRTASRICLRLRPIKIRKVYRTTTDEREHFQKLFGGILACQMGRFCLCIVHAMYLVLCAARLLILVRMLVCFVPVVSSLP